MRKSLLTLVLAIILWMWPKSTSNKSKINKSDYIKLKAFCKVKEMTLKMKRQSMEQENKIFANSASDKAWISKMYKELIQLNSKNTIIIIWLKSRQELDRHFPKKICKWPTGTWKDTQYHLSSRESKSKPPWDITLHC